MSAAGHLHLQVRKEVAALAPMWIASTVVVALGAAVQDARFWYVSLFAFLLGSFAMGAHSIGHEYGHRTLGVLLAQPCDRRRLWLTKLAVLAAMLLVLTALAWWTLFRDPDVLRQTGWQHFPRPVLVALSAFCLAPWFTMLCRSTMAGVVFTLAVSPVLVLVGNLLGNVKYGANAAAPIGGLTFAVHFWGLLIACAVGAIAGWRAFMWLQVVEGTGREFHLPIRGAAHAGARRHGPLVSLIFKELRFQQLTFLLCGIFAAGLIALVLAPVRSGTLYRTVLPMTLVYTALLSVLIGSLAVAEERQFGTFDLQRLLPVAVWKQWAVKAGVAFALVATLGIVGLLVLRVLLRGDPALFQLQGVWRSQALLIAILTSTSLYVSSLSSSGVRAVVMSFPAVFGLGLMISAGDYLLGHVARSPLQFWLGSLVPAHLRDDMLHAFRWAPLLYAAMLAAVMLVMAFLNYRNSERTRRRFALQVLSVAAVVVLVLTAEFVHNAVVAAMVRDYREATGR